MNINRFLSGNLRTTGTPWERGVRLFLQGALVVPTGAVITGISAMNSAGASTSGFALTIVDTKGVVLLRDYPICDLFGSITAGTNNRGRIREFCLLNADLQRSYVTFTETISWAINTDLFNLNFYYSL